VAIEKVGVAKRPDRKVMTQVDVTGAMPQRAKATKFHMAGFGNMRAGMKS
jgi:hypothetical protein